MSKDSITPVPVDSLPAARSHPRGSKYWTPEIRSALDASPGTWFLIFKAPKVSTTQATSARIRKLAGSDYEVVTRKGEDGLVGMYARRVTTPAKPRRKR